MKSVNKDKSFEADIKRLGAVLASIRDGVIVVDIGGRVIAANPASEFFTDVMPGEILGKNILEILKFACTKTDPSWFLPEALAGWRAVALPGDCSLLRPHGGSLPTAATTTPLYTADDKYVGIVVVLRDLTEEAAAKQRQFQFLSMVAHQLRQPFSLLRMGLENILDSKEKEERFESSQIELLGDLYKVVLESMDVINDLLSLSRLERGMVELKMEEVDVRQVVGEVAEEFKGLAVGKNVELHLPPAFAEASADAKALADKTAGKPGAATPFMIRADQARLRDVFQNLIVNAILYNKPRGEVNVGIARASQKEITSTVFKPEDLAEIPGTRYVLISVSDTGMGIPENEQNRIFESFFRGSNVIKKGLRGTGLGLAIVKSMVEKFGGRIAFESKVDAGTTFYLVFPESGPPQARLAEGGGSPRSRSGEAGASEAAPASYQP